jgi:hypothetical protein
MTDQLMIDGVEDERARWAAFDACFTPEAVVEQGLRWLEWHSLIRVARVLDPCAGAGIFGKVARRLWPEAWTVGVEPRVEENCHRHYDATYLATAQEFGTTISGKTRYELVSTNPPWGSGQAVDNWGDIFDAVWPLVADRGMLALLGPSTWGHSDEASERVDVFERVCPAYQLRIRGRIAFNGGSSTDNRKCSWWVWCNDGVARDSTTMINLPALPAEARRWTVRPGTEE